MVETLTPEALQPVVSDAPRAFQYCTDALSAYEKLDYRNAFHLVAPGKSQTYSVEANNAELRHNLAQLSRRTRCFWRSRASLERTLAMFVYCWNKARLRGVKYWKALKDELYVFI